jgi:hypothetical protein
MEGVQMSAEKLLLWMSARRAGTWQQFRSAVESLHLPLSIDDSPSLEDFDRGGLPDYQRLRLALEKLGHAEFFANSCENGWRVAPPVLAISELDQEWKGIACGARSPRLLTVLRTAAKDCNLTLQSEDFPDQPSIIRFVGTREALTRLATESGMSVQTHAPLAILSCIPTVDDKRYWNPAVLPMGADWTIDRFDPESLGWRAASRVEAAASINRFFRFVFGHERHYFLASRGTLWKLRGPGQGQIGKYIVLHRCRRRVLRYFADTNELVIPAACRPPLLVERALSLCSGILPTFDRESSIVRYRGIPIVVAKAAAHLLRQEI